MLRFINTAWIILLVNAATPGPSTYFETKYPVTLSFTRLFYFFRGEHRDFSVGWYQSVGTTFIVTLLLNVVEPHIMVGFNFLLMRIKICCCRRSRVMQYDLNALYTGFDFEPEVRYPQVRFLDSTTD